MKPLPVYFRLTDLLYQLHPICIKLLKMAKVDRMDGVQINQETTAPMVTDIHNNNCLSAVAILESGSLNFTCEVYMLGADQLNQETT